ncbi:MAG: DUF2914 domain-containing protein [Nitrospirae bacterium]|nr:DUF2914 domain-containing protein [Nitrospirota bacterium]MBI3352401.1 DUF2914 domain-containing protein [Nitrospirota bacterium]
MFKKHLISMGCMGVFLIVLSASLCYGAESLSQEIKVEEGFVSADSGQLVSSTRQPIPVFYNDAGKFYAVTKISKGPENTQIKHLWFLRDQIILDATLPVKENQTRAVSGLIMKPNWMGKWRVDITSADGTLLYSIPFVVKRKPENIQANDANSSSSEHLETAPLPISGSPTIKP